MLLKHLFNTPFFLILILCLLYTFVEASEFNQDLEIKDYGTQGKLFPIIETSLLDLIMEKLNIAQKEGKIAQLQEEFTNKVIKKIKTPSPIAGITKAENHRSWDFDPTIVSNEILGSNGQIIVKAGTTINPLDTLEWGDPTIFIDGDDEDQVKWASGQVGSIILIKGSPLELNEQLAREIFFDQGGLQTKKFGIKAVPAIVKQEGRVLRITEVVIGK